jgi:hypothetical protein
MASNNFAIISATSPDSSGRLPVLATQEIKFEAETQVTYLDSALEKKVPIGWVFSSLHRRGILLVVPVSSEE